MLARGRGYAGAPPLVPGPLRRPPSGFALAAAFDTVKADEHSAHGGRERVSVGKRHSTADAQLNQGERRRSILTAHDSFHGRTGGGACRLSEFGAVATLHGLGEESDLPEQPVVKFGLTLDGRLGVLGLGLELGAR